MTTPRADGGSAVRAISLDDALTGLVPASKARVGHGRPVTAGPAVCQGCGLLVWWSGALWSDRDGTWHRPGCAA